MRFEELNDLLKGLNKFFKILSVKWLSKGQITLWDLKSQMTLGALKNHVPLHYKDLVLFTYEAIQKTFDKNEF